MMVTLAFNELILNTCAFHLLFSTFYQILLSVLSKIQTPDLDVDQDKWRLLKFTTTLCS